MEIKNKKNSTTSLSIISGKGGCGKTTLALGLSQILANCGLKVLLVDCDLSTHGATYFFENHLIDKDIIYTTYDLVSKNCETRFNEKNILNVRNNIDFIPSSVYLNNEIKDSDIFVDKASIDVVTEKYDIVIYDCQAGFSVITDKLTEISDKNLVVLEPDAVTSSATRVLSSQLKQLNSGNTFQVFNKITGEDYGVYSLVTHGTFYTNLTPIRYDLSVKKAFAYNELPSIDIDKTSFSNDMILLAKALFQQFRNCIETFLVELKKKKIGSCENELFYLRKKKRKYMTKRIMESVYALAIMISFIFSLFLTNAYMFDFKETSDIIKVVIGVVSMMAAVIALTKVISVSFIKKNEENVYSKIKSLEKEVDDLYEYISQAQITSN